MPVPLELVVFDLGGVLVHIARTWEEACASAGLPPAPASAPDGYVTPINQATADFQLGRIDTREWCEAVARASDRAYSATDAGRVLQAWTRHQYDRIDEVFDVLDAHGIATAVFSNTNAAHWHRRARAVVAIPSTQSY